jgi:hypothetical protein
MLQSPYCVYRNLIQHKAKATTAIASKSFGGMISTLIFTSYFKQNKQWMNYKDKYVKQNNQKI